VPRRLRTCQVYARARVLLRPMNAQASKLAQGAQVLPGTTSSVASRN